MTDELTIPPTPSEVADAAFREAVARMAEDPSVAMMLTFFRTQNEVAWFNGSVNRLTP